MNTETAGEAVQIVGVVATEIIAVVIFCSFVIVTFWRIFSKAGFHGALSFLMLIPIINIGMILFLAFSQWPIHKNKNEV